MEENVKEIPLRNGGVTLVDDDDYPFLSKLQWSRMDEDNTSYVCFGGVLARKVRCFLMHRFMTGFKSCEIDHIDGNGLNNQRANLRLATKSQNQHNRGPMKKGSSRFKGVWRHGDKWRVGITLNRKKIHIG